MANVNFNSRDLAEERGHVKCIDFLRNPEKAFMEQKRTQAATRVKLHGYDRPCLFPRSHILSFLPQDINRAELGLLMTQKDPYTGKTNKKKTLRTFSFLSKIKVDLINQHWTCWLHPIYYRIGISYSHAASIQFISLSLHSFSVFRNQLLLWVSSSRKTKFLCSSSTGW